MPVLFFSHPQNYDFLMRPNKEPNINQDLRKRSEDDRILFDCAETCKEGRDSNYLVIREILPSTIAV